MRVGEAYSEFCMGRLKPQWFSLSALIVGSSALLVFIFPISVFAETVIPAGSNLSWNQTWTKEGSPYIIQGNVYVRFGSITINPGAVVKVMDGATVTLHADVHVNIAGTLEEPVIFTSFKDDSISGDTNGDGSMTAPTPGDWGYMSLGGGGTNNNMRVQYLRVRYGGAVPVTYGSIYAGLFTASPALLMDFPWFSGNPGAGYVVENIEVSQSADTGLLLNVGANHSVVVSNSSFFDNQTYGIQKVRLFDSRGRDQTGALDLSGNWWGSDTGPYHATLNPSGAGNAIAGTKLALADWLSENPLADKPSSPDPVIVIPGILGSWEKNGELVIDPVLHTYDDLINTFVLNGFVEGETIFPFPYEWRQSNIFTAGLLRDKINEVQDICKCEKVDLVAHSMGGLVARYYIQSGLYEDDVDQLIFLGTPHLGSVNSYLTWEGGEFAPSTFDFINKAIFELEARRLGFNSIFDYIRGRPVTSIQQLLPTFDYLREKDIDILREYPNYYPSNTFLENLNANVFELINSGVDITNIVGNTDNNTITALRVVGSVELPKWEYGFPESFGNKSTDQGFELGIGDTTVPLFSANFVNENLIEVHSGHKEIVLESQSTVFKILTGRFPDPISVNAPFPNVVLLFKVLSPVDIKVVAPDGKRLGKDFETGGELNEISGAFYSGFLTDNEYITIPNPLDGEYKIITQGTDNGGKYTIVAGYASDESLTMQEEKSYTLAGDFEEITVSVDNQNPENSTINDTTPVTYEKFQSHIIGAFEQGWIIDEQFKNLLQTLVSSSEGTREREKVKPERALLHVLQIELENGLKNEKLNQNGFELLKEDVEGLLGW